MEDRSLQLARPINISQRRRALGEVERERRVARLAPVVEAVLEGEGLPGLDGCAVGGCDDAGEDHVAGLEVRGGGCEGGGYYRGEDSCEELEEAHGGKWARGGEAGEGGWMGFHFIPVATLDVQ